MKEKTVIKRLGNKNWVKGKSGNPKSVFKKGNKAAVGHGRPPKLPNLDEVLARVLGKENKKGVTELEQIMERMKASAKQGNTKAATLVLDRGYGKAPQSIDLTTLGEKFNITPPEIKIYTGVTPPLAAGEDEIKEPK